MTDYAVGDTLYHKFSTRAFATGIPTTLSGTPVVSIYEDDSVTEITAGITLTADFDSKQGLNHLTVVATGGNGYEAGKYYQAVITTGTVGGVSIVGETIWTFSLDASGAVAGISALNDPTAAAIADAVHEESLEDHVTEGTTGYAQMLAVYAGPHGPGIYIDSDAANTNTVKGTDGTESNPVSTFVAARTLADGIGTDTYYLETGTDLTLAATHANWRFFGLGSPTDTEIDLGSQDVSLAKFDHINIKGDQGGAGRLFAEDCVLSDPGAGTTTLNILGLRCGIEDDITLDTSNDNVLIDSYSLVAGGAAPIVRASGASGTLIMNGHKGGVDLRDLSASHNLTVNIAGGQVIFDASCNVNANVELRGIGTKTDNTAGMADLNEVAFINMDKINTEADIAISDAALATAANLATAQEDLDIITDSDGVVLGDAGVDKIFDEALSGHTTAGTSGWNLLLAGSILVDTTITGTPTTTTLQLTAGSSVDNFYNDQEVYVVSGTGAGQVRPVLSYVGATKTITVDEPFATTPAAADRVVVQSEHTHPISQVADAVLDEILSGHTTAGSLGKAVADIETDATAIKAKTDDLTYTKANELDINIQSVNDVTVNGTGASGDEWGP